MAQLREKLEKEKLRQEKLRLVEEKDGLHIQTEKLAEESAYAKELASQAAVELKNLAEEVTKLSFQNTKLQNDLMKAQEVTFQNAKLQTELTKLQSELKKAQETAFALASMKSQPSSGRSKLSNGDNHTDGETTFSGRGTLSRANGGSNNLNRGGGGAAGKNGKSNNTNDVDGNDTWQQDPEVAINGLKKELEAAKVKETTLTEKETALQKKLEGAKQRETNLENDLASMWVLVAKLKKEKEAAMNQSARTDFQDSYQEEFRTNGAADQRVQDTVKIPMQPSSKHRNSKDIDTLTEKLAKTDIHDSFGKNFWSNGGEVTTLDQEELYSGYPTSSFQTLTQSNSFGSSNPVLLDSELDSHSNQSNPFLERHDSNGAGAKGVREGMRSLEELKTFMEEERRRGSELGTLVSQLKANPAPSTPTNPFLSHHFAQHNGTQHTTSDFEAGAWPPFESSSFYKS